MYHRHLLVSELSFISNLGVRVFNMIIYHNSSTMSLQSWNLQMYLLQVLPLFIWNVTLLLTGGPSIKQFPVLLIDG